MHINEYLSRKKTPILLIYTIVCETYYTQISHCTPASVCWWRVCLCVLQFLPLYYEACACGWGGVGGFYEQWPREY